MVKRGRSNYVTHSEKNEDFLLQSYAKGTCVGFNPFSIQKQSSLSLSHWKFTNTSMFMGGRRHIVAWPVPT